MTTLTESQIAILEALHDYRSKVILRNSMLFFTYVLFGLFVYFLFIKEYQQCYIAGSGSTLWGGLTFLVYRHYFSLKNLTKKGQ
jgi:hypothetical protein